MRATVICTLVGFSASFFPVVAAAQSRSDEVDELLLEFEDRLADLETSVDEVERKAILDRIHFGADYRLLFNSYTYTGPGFDYDYQQNAFVAQPVTRNTAEVWSHRVRIPMQATPIEQLRLTARLVMFKHFGDSDQAAFIQDFSSTRVPRDSGIRFEQAWLDWFMLPWMTLSVGRLSYTDVNPPVELKENSNRRNPTFGLHVVDGEYETLNLTMSPSEGTWRDLYLRVFYTSWFNDSDDVLGQLPFLSSGLKNQQIFGWSIDLKVPGLGETFVQVGHYMIPRFRPFVIPIPDPAFNADADFTNAPAPLNGSLLFPSRLPGSLGSYNNFNALIELIDVAGSGLDVFAAGTLGILAPNGKGIEYELPNPMTGERQSTPALFLASQGDSGRTYSYLVGARWTIPVLASEQRLKLGIEYNYGSRYHISFTVPNDQLLNKLSARGRAIEGYLIVPIYGERFFLRLGYLQIRNKYLTGFFGPNPDPNFAGSTAPEAPQTIGNFNAVLNARL